ncbi:hypothetical protein ACJJIE_01620 [Microbulbifer sp. TRSA001]
MKKLAAIFAFNIAAYAVMSNHYCIVLYIGVEAAKTWSDTEILTP